MQKMNFCAYCGSKLDSNSTRCPVCGAEQNAVKNEPATVNVKEPYNSNTPIYGNENHNQDNSQNNFGVDIKASNEPVKEKKKKRTPIKVVLIACCTIILLICAFIILNVTHVINFNDNSDIKSVVTSYAQKYEKVDDNTVEVTAPDFSQLIKFYYGKNSGVNAEISGKELKKLVDEHSDCTKKYTFDVDSFESENVEKAFLSRVSADLVIESLKGVEYEEGALE